MPRRRLTVRRSPIHGHGVFALTHIDAGDVVSELRGDVLRWEEASQPRVNVGAEPGQTFLFDVGDGLVIDARRDGNIARWINHGCEPNCAAEAMDRKVVITASRDIARGEELLLDYQLRIPGGPTAADCGLYVCGCGAPTCRSTMLSAYRNRAQAPR